MCISQRFQLRWRRPEFVSTWHKSTTSHRPTHEILTKSRIETARPVHPGHETVWYGLVLRSRLDVYYLSHFVSARDRVTTRLHWAFPGRAFDKRLKNAASKGKYDFGISLCLFLFDLYSRGLAEGVCIFLCYHIFRHSASGIFSLPSSAEFKLIPFMRVP